MLAIDKKINSENNYFFDFNKLKIIWIYIFYNNKNIKLLLINRYAINIKNEKLLINIDNLL